MLDLIFLTLVSGVILYRLYTTLGRKGDGAEGPARSSKPQVAKVIPLSRDRQRQSRVASISSLPEVYRPLEPLLKTDSSFDPEEFLKGAKGAFKMIVEAFAKGDRKSLKPLLSPTVYKNFVSVIENRESKGEKLETSVESFQNVKAIRSGVQGRLAEATVSFVSNQISTFKKASGETIETDPESFDEVTDVWTFARDTRSTNPNWQLVGVEEGEV
ncbi:MAG: Tim44 domain-containing protein [bacterium]|nr:Tim44 domain-containing protein [bacterium]